MKGHDKKTAEAVKDAADRTYYASHVYNPLFYAGIKSIAGEVYEQIGVPDDIVVPVGNGSLLLGVYLGFLNLSDMPRIIAVQSENCAPVFSPLGE